MVHVFAIEGMNCGHCVNRIATALKEAKLDAEVRLVDKTVVLHNQSEEDIHKAREVIEDLGYGVSNK